MIEQVENDLHTLWKRMCMQMTRPVPLMFINSPQSAVRLPETQEQNAMILVEDESVEITSKPTLEENKEKASVLEQLEKIQSPFGRHLYQPLQFKLVDGAEVLGTLRDVKGDKMIISQDGNEEQSIALPINALTDILWHGKSIGAL